jgi:CII-binding regulator of phage lambda lysogenization HflD
MGALQATGKEAELRDRILAQFSASQNRLEAIGVRMEEIDQQLNATDKEIKAMLKALA